MNKILALLAASGGLLFAQAAMADHPAWPHFKPHHGVDIQIVLGQPKPVWVHRDGRVWDRDDDDDDWDDRDDDWDDDDDDDDD
ncbi:hypothetical protein [Limnobacter sp.]|uniref:hypothetical protein n=1 Tax=Limnobacter sp. TaxID=2003368 RepID=UPI003512EA92